jgi:Ser/Thr protein kinase RdoA (MazF antagonist)
MIPVPQAVMEHLALAYGTQAGELRFFSGGSEGSDGVLYAYPYQDRRRLLKILAFPAGQESDELFRMEERLRFARFAGEHQVRMVYPHLSPQGRLYETLKASGQIWAAYSMELAPGRTPTQADQTPEFIRQWGQILGKLHRATLAYPSWQACTNPENGHALLTWQEEWQYFYDLGVDLEVRAKWVELRSRLEKLPMPREAYGFIHNDAHIWNLLVENGEITLLDFDVSNHHWFANDLAVACQHVLFDISGGMDAPLHNREALVDFLRYLLEGYRQEYDLAPEWLDTLDLFIAYRRALLFIVMHGWIASQTEMHASWKRMILEAPEMLGEIKL